MDIVMLIRIPAILIALTVHEFFHGYVAYRCGDSTAKNSGRLSFNPLVHLDPIGTLMLLFGPFGWAKPVPVNPLELANPKRDMVKVAVAGPLSNIALAIPVGVIIGSSIFGTDLFPTAFDAFLVIFYRINLGLALFNLLPVYPLDGYNIVAGLLSHNHLARFMQSMVYLPKILLVMLVGEFLFNIPLFSRFIVAPLFTPWFSFWDLLLFNIGNTLF